MRAKLLAGAAALALTACTALASAAPASAAPWGWHHHGWRGGWGPAALAAGVIGGAVAAATSPLWGPRYYDYAWGPAYPVYDYVPAAPAVVVGGGGVAWCEAHFRSYNPATGMYLGYDGVHHRCG